MTVIIIGDELNYCSLNQIYEKKLVYFNNLMTSNLKLQNIAYKSILEERGDHPIVLPPFKFTI